MTCALRWQETGRKAAHPCLPGCGSPPLVALFWLRLPRDVELEASFGPSPFFIALFLLSLLSAVSVTGTVGRTARTTACPHPTLIRFVSAADCHCGASTYAHCTGLQSMPMDTTGVAVHYHAFHHDPVVWSWSSWIRPCGHLLGFLHLWMDHTDRWRWRWHW